MVNCDLKKNWKYKKCLIKLYHGTTQTNAKKIIKEGIKPIAQVTTSKEYALKRARVSSGFDFKEPKDNAAILELSLPKPLVEKNAKELGYTKKEIKRGKLSLAFKKKIHPKYIKKKFKIIDKPK